MKKQGRTTLICRKELSCGVMDMFEVVVASNERDIAKKKYESIGYHVSVKKQLTNESICGIIHICQNEVELLYDED